MCCQDLSSNRNSDENIPQNPIFIHFLYRRISKRVEDFIPRFNKQLSRLTNSRDDMTLVDSRMRISEELPRNS